MTTHDARLLGWTRPQATHAAERDERRSDSLLAAMSRSVATIGCITGWIAFVCVFVCAVTVSTLIVSGLAAVLAAAFLVP